MNRRFLAIVLALVVVGFAVFGLPSPPGKKAHAQAGAPGYILLASGWNIGSVTSGTAVFGTNLKPTQAGSVIRIGVVLGSSVTLAIYETDASGHTFTSLLNGGTALTGGCLYTFVWEARNSAAIGGPTANSTGFNFIVGGPSAVPVLRVTECTSGVD